MILTKLVQNINHMMAVAVNFFFRMFDSSLECILDANPLELECFGDRERWFYCIILNVFLIAEIRNGYAKYSRSRRLRR